MIYFGRQMEFCHCAIILHIYMQAMDIHSLMCNVVKKKNSWIEQKFTDMTNRDSVYAGQQHGMSSLYPNELIEQQDYVLVRILNGWPLVLRSEWFKDICSDRKPSWLFCLPCKYTYPSSTPLVCFEFTHQRIHLRPRGNLVHIINFVRLCDMESKCDDNDTNLGSVQFSSVWSIW